MVFGIWHPLRHIIIIIIHIIIFLFRTASADLIVHFLLKPMGIYFLHCWPVSLCFKSFVL